MPRKGSHFWRTLLAFTGPGLLVAVGYMDPGNWATDLAGGARYGYLLLSVVFGSNLMAILLQYLSLKLGIATGLDLAQACRAYYSKPVTWALWVLCEVAIVACDLAEVIGSAVALQLLFGMPLVWGVALTSLDVLVILLLPEKNFRLVEILVALLILVVGGCFAYELLLAKPAWSLAAHGLVPSLRILREPGALFIAAGILGATVMPHNLYLHSSIVQTRAYPRDDEGKSMALRFATIDSTVSLLAAFFVNAAILVLSAAAFHGSGRNDVADISDAYHLLTPLLGDPYAGVIFAIALLASGQNSTITGTLAGQIVMEGFLNWRVRPWVRRLITRGLAIIPAALVAGLADAKHVGSLLIWSQVVLSIQLSFAVVPLVMFTSDRVKMGRFVNPGWIKALAWTVTLFIVALNLWLVSDFLTGAPLSG